MRLELASGLPCAMSLLSSSLFPRADHEARTSRNSFCKSLVLDCAQWLSWSMDSRPCLACAQACSSEESCCFKMAHWILASASWSSAAAATDARGDGVVRTTFAPLGLPKFRPGPPTMRRGGVGVDHGRDTSVARQRKRMLPAWQPLRCRPAAAHEGISVLYGSPGREWLQVGTRCHACWPAATSVATDAAATDATGIAAIFWPESHLCNSARSAATTVSAASFSSASLARWASSSARRPTS